MVFYQAFGLCLSSELALNHFLPLSPHSRPDVSISIGLVPETIPSPIHQGRWMQASQKDYLLEIPQLGKFLVSDGRKIVVEPFDGIELHILNTYLLGIILAPLLFQRKMFPLHASAVSNGKQCYLFAADSGTGKSTMAANFITDGFKLIADDICVLSIDKGGNPTVQGGNFRMKLSNASIRSAAFDAKAALGLGKFDDKHSIELAQQSISEAVKLDHLIFISKEERNENSITSLTASEAMSKLIRYTYKPQLLKFFHREAHFHQALYFANRAAASHFERSTSSTINESYLTIREKLLSRASLPQTEALLYS